MRIACETDVPPAIPAKSHYLWKEGSTQERGGGGRRSRRQKKRTDKKDDDNAMQTTEITEEERLRREQRATRFGSATAGSTEMNAS